MKIIVRCTKMFDNGTDWEEPKGSYVDFDIVKHTHFSKYLKRGKANWPMFAAVVIDSWNKDLSEYWSYQIISVEV